MIQHFSFQFYNIDDNSYRSLNCRISQELLISISNNIYGNIPDEEERYVLITSSNRRCRVLTYCLCQLKYVNIAIL